MKWMETAVYYSTDAAFGEMARELVCDLFYTLGLGGVITEDFPARNDVIRGCVKGYFYSDPTGVKKLAYLKKKADQLTDQGGVSCEIKCSEVDDEDWANAWKDHFHITRIGTRLIIKPSWQSYEPARDDIVIELDPGMAFGTGTHPTTSLCLEMIEKYVRKGHRVLDVGTGSGILMIAAKKCGAASVWGVDNDPVAVTVARENLLLNQVDEADFRIISGDLVRDVDGRFNVVVANILSNVIIDLIPALNDIMTEDAVFISSGIIEEKADAVRAVLETQGFRILEIVREDAWVCMAADRAG
ncbi:MAG: 50S ribosomal protein L11 methyltransferase [Thermodesulfobacteriota bacterium]|nr:50S ribosomal protein L11 methyltransferase [Thermodesulfobacteriota bacterium]